MKINLLKLFLIICACITIFYFTLSGIIFIGLLTLGYMGVKYLMFKLKHKIGKIFN